MTVTVIAADLAPSRAAIALLAAGHGDAAADVLVASDRIGSALVDLVRDGSALRVQVKGVTP